MSGGTEAPGGGVKALPRLRGLPVLLWGPGADRLAGWMAPAFAFAVPISVSADAVFLGAILLLVLLGGGWREKLDRLLGNPPALAALAVFLALLVGLSWSEAPWMARLSYLGRYSDLGAIALLLPVFADAEVRRRTLLAFLAAMLLTALLSFALRFGWISGGGIWHGGPDSPTPFRSSIAQGLMMAYAAFVAAECAGDRQSGLWRRSLWLFAAVALFDLLFLVPGRTGYVVAGVLAVYGGMLRFGGRGAAIAALGAAILFGVAYLLSPTFHTRLEQAVIEAEQASPDAPAETSVGLRLEYWRNTATLIAQAPLLGHGTGSFAAAYARLVDGTAMEASRNPHNDLLHLAAQLGLIGVALLLVLYVVTWRWAARLPSPADRAMARGLVLAFAAGGMFNTLLMDHTEGRVFMLFAALLFAALPPRRDRRAAFESAAPGAVP
jgi:O-antigen ligase